MATFTLPICVSCARFRDTTDLDVGPTCEAFPAGIPEDIWDGGFDHREAHPGDDGVRYEQAEGDRAAAALQLFDKSKTYALAEGGD